MSISEIEPTIYLAAEGQGLQTYSIGNSEVRNCNGSQTTTTYVRGVTHDAVHDKVYWSGFNYIWWENRDESEAEVVLSTDKCELAVGLPHPDLLPNSPMDRTMG